MLKIQYTQFSMVLVLDLENLLVINCALEDNYVQITLDSFQLIHQKIGTFMIMILMVFWDCQWERTQLILIKHWLITCIKQVYKVENKEFHYFQFILEILHMTTPINFILDMSMSLLKESHLNTIKLLKLIWVFGKLESQIYSFQGVNQMYAIINSAKAYYLVELMLLVVVFS